MALTQRMLEINVIVVQYKLWVETSSNNWEAANVTAIQHLEARFTARMLQAHKELPEISCHAHLVINLRGVSFISQTH